MTIRPVIKQTYSLKNLFIHFLTNSFRKPRNRVANYLLFKAIFDNDRFGHFDVERLMIGLGNPLPFDEGLCEAFRFQQSC